MKQIDYIGNLEKWKQGFVFSIPIFVRFSETDLLGHVNNVSPFIYFEEARIKYLASLGLFTDLQTADYAPIVSDLQCDFHKQMYFGEAIKLFVKVASVGNTSFDLHYKIINESGDLCVTGRGRLVNVNVKTGKPEKLDDHVKDVLRSS